MAELNGAQWAEVKRLFAVAAELRPEECLDYLQRACPDPDLRREVASLLEYSGDGLPAADQAIAVAAAELSLEPDPDERLIGARLGPYRVDAIVGHGGMGAVYRASRDDSEFHQQVAIKLVRVAAESPGTLRRFRQERQILARLSHPNIARLLDGGSTPEGVPYLVMEFIEGEPLTTWCDRHSLSVAARLRLFLRICDAVDFAHRDQVVHRDLKPANILVTEDGTPKLLDFGIAKMLDADAEGDAGTLTGLQAMTPEYASPEQVRGAAASTATDVYALGLILYELLTGEQAQPMTSRTVDAIARVVCHMEPPAPAQLKAGLAGDLDNIVRMAIRKEPERRYASAGELARDIQRHLEGRPVSARPDTIGYRSAKFLRRNRVAAAAAVLIAVSLAGGLALQSWLGSRVPRVLQMVQITQTGRVPVGGGVAADGARVYFSERSGGSRSLAQVSAKGGTPAPLPVTPALALTSILDISPDHSRLLVAARLAGQDDNRLWAVPTAGGEARLISNAPSSTGAWSPDGKRIVFGWEGSLSRINTDGTGYRKLLEMPDASVADVRWAPAQGSDVVRLCIMPHATWVGALWQVNADGAGLHRLLPGWPSGTAHPDGDYNGSWIPSGKYYLFRSRRGAVSKVWALPESRSWLPSFYRRPIQIYSGPQDLNPLAPSPDGKRVFFAAGQDRQELVRYDSSLRQFMPYLSGIAARWLSYSPDGRWVAYTLVPANTLWKSLPDGSQAIQLTSAPLSVHQPRWSPDGSRIVFNGSRPGEPYGKLYTVSANSSGAAAAECITSAPFLEVSASWSPDGKSLVFRRDLPPGVPGTPGLYVMGFKTRKAELLPESRQLSPPAWSPDPRYIAATNGAASQILLFDFRTRLWTPLAAGRALGVPYWSRDGKYVYYQDQAGGAKQPIFRVRIADRHTEKLMDSGSIPQSNVTEYVLTGLAPGDAPVAMVLRTNSDLYALDVDLP